MISRIRIEKIFGALIFGLLLAGCGPEPASRGRVVLIGLDGASWNLLDPMVEAGELPHFKALMDRGGHRRSGVGAALPVSAGLDFDRHQPQAG